jgi:hypothetical protein
MWPGHLLEESVGLLRHSILDVSHSLPTKWGCPVPRPRQVSGAASPANSVLPSTLYNDKFCPLDPRGGLQKVFSHVARCDLILFWSYLDRLRVGR